MSTDVNGPSTLCEVDVHEHLTLIECDGLSVWKCNECGQVIDEAEIINNAINECCARILHEVNNPTSGRFGSKYMNEIVDRIRKAEKSLEIYENHVFRKPY